ncbi:hypothetical protein HPB51_010704 [Rhipicephalus microplus]|uniref:Uncharacterized protein n=1 Tax=Rhipicephalus microplus TaxID=6941 RepID=A0A9J6F1B7_RHIMP|nr:hypothetical protein HPB51_010704 [Rhipicephalus microplus]
MPSTTSRHKWCWLRRAYNRTSLAYSCLRGTSTMWFCILRGTTWEPGGTTCPPLKEATGANKAIIFRGAQVEYPGKGQPSNRTRDRTGHQNTYLFEEKTGNKTPTCTHRDHGNLIAESYRASTNNSKDCESHINGWGKKTISTAPRRRTKTLKIKVSTTLNQTKVTQPEHGTSTSAGQPPTRKDCEPSDSTPAPGEQTSALSSKRYDLRKYCGSTRL